MYHLIFPLFIWSGSYDPPLFKIFRIVTTIWRMERDNIPSRFNLIGVFSILFNTKLDFVFIIHSCYTTTEYISQLIKDSSLTNLISRNSLLLANSLYAHELHIFTVMKQKTIEISLFYKMQKRPEFWVSDLILMHIINYRTQEPSTRSSYQNIKLFSICNIMQWVRFLLLSYISAKARP